MTSLTKSAVWNFPFSRRAPKEELDLHGPWGASAYSAIDLLKPCNRHTTVHVRCGVAEESTQKSSRDYKTLWH